MEPTDRPVHAQEDEITMTARYGCSTFCCMDLPLPEALALVREKTDRIEIVSEGFHDLFRYHEACHAVDARYSVHARSRTSISRARTTASAPLDSA